MYPVPLELGPSQLRAYGVFVALAILMEIWFSAREARRAGLAPGVIVDAARPIVLAARVGAWLYDGLFAIGYGVARFIVEFFRGDPPVVAGVVVPQAVSALLVVAAASAWWWRRASRERGVLGAP